MSGLLLFRVRLSRLLLSQVFNNRLESEVTKSPSRDTVSSEMSAPDSGIPIPVALRPLVDSLDRLEDVSREETISILFVVRMGDSLHRAFYGTSLNLALVGKLCEKLNIPDLSLEIEVFQTRWYFRRAGMVSTRRLSWDYDMYSVAVLCKIGRGVLNGRLTPMEGLQLIRKHETKKDYARVERWYRAFPARLFVIPIMSASCATVFFNGTWLDFGFSAICGLVAGILAWFGTLHDQILLVTDYLVAIVVAMISVATVVAYPDSTCFSAQILGTLYWFFYGTAFVLSLYEVTSNHLTVGVTRYVFAILKSYGLAFGTMLGVWIATYAGTDRLEVVLGQDCDKLQYRIPGGWEFALFFLAAVACLMQFRATIRDWPVCLLIQFIAYGLQYYIGTTLDYPDILSNLIPAFVATVASHVCVVTLPSFQSRSVNAFLDAEKKEIMEDPVEKSSCQPDTAAASNETSEGDEEEEEEQPLVRELPALPTPDSLNDASTDEENGHCTDLITYVDAGWAGKGSEHVSSGSSPGTRSRWAGKDTTGYIQDSENDQLENSRSDTWFCLLPALYLLVPGSKLLQEALLGILASLEKDENASNFSKLASSWLEIGLSQAIGLRLGFAFLWLCRELKVLICTRLCNQREPPIDLENRSHDLD